MANPADAKRRGYTPMREGFYAACAAMVGMGIATSWTIESLMPVAIGLGIGTAMYHSGLARQAPRWLRFLGLLVVSVALGVAVHVLLESR